jgi:glutamyl-tRNA reductase
MRLFAVGLSHRTAPIELRERVDFSRLGLSDALEALARRNIAREMAILSTCNRSEVYVASDADRTVEGLFEFFAEYHDVPAADVTPHLYVHHGADAARHLLRVAAGLDSLVVGEPQILGQVKSAYAVASDANFTGTILNRLFHVAFTAGKRVRSETGLGEGAVSVSYAAIALAKKIFGDLSGLEVLVLGAGEMAKLTAIHLKAQQVRRMTIASRTRTSAERLASHVSGEVVDWMNLGGAIERADILLTATGAPQAIITRADLARVMKTRRGRALFVIDIAVPRDVEPDAGAVDQVFLYNIDDLQGIVKENLARRTAELERADAIIAEETARFAAWLQSRHVIPTVVALRERFESIRKAELQRLRPKLSALPPEAQAQVDHVTRLIVEKLLLSPTEQLKSLGDHSLAATYTDALNRLFSLPSPGERDEEPVVAGKRTSS